MLVICAIYAILPISKMNKMGQKEPALVGAGSHNIRKYFNI